MCSCTNYQRLSVGLLHFLLISLMLCILSVWSKYGPRFDKYSKLTSFKPLFLTASDCIPVSHLHSNNNNNNQSKSILKQEKHQQQQPYKLSENRFSRLELKQKVNWKLKEKRKIFLFIALETVSHFTIFVVYCGVCIVVLKYNSVHRRLCSLNISSVGCLADLVAFSSVCSLFLLLLLACKVNVSSKQFPL